MTSGRFVIDNSVVMSWCFEDEGGKYPEAVLGSLEHGEAVVPAVWPLEVGNVLLAAERMNRLGEASVTRFLELLADLPISVEQEAPERMLREIISLARKQSISTCDASYLDLAMRLGLPLATLDRSMRGCARRLDIPLYKPSS